MDSPVIIPVSEHDRNLDEFDSEEIRSADGQSLMVVVDPGPPRHTPGLPKPFSRVEAAKVHRERSSFLSLAKGHMRGMGERMNNGIARAMTRGRATIDNAQMRAHHAATTVIYLTLGICRWSARQGRAVLHSTAATLRQSFAAFIGYGVALDALVSVRLDSWVAVSGRAINRVRVTSWRAALYLVRRAEAGVGAARHGSSIACRTIGRQMRHALTVANAARVRASHQSRVAARRTIECATRFALAMGQRSHGLATPQALPSLRRRSMAARVYARRGVAIIRRHAALLVHKGAHSIRNAMDAAHGYWGRTDAPAVEGRAIRHLESDGALIATALGVVAIAYGGLLFISWSDPAPPAHATVATIQPARVDTINLPQSGAPVANEAVPRNRAFEAGPRARVISASTLNTIWRRNDTRSLQQAFERLRRETLAFHRCGLQITADRAVARCDGVASGVTDGASAAPRARWTFDFQRTGGRWAIQRVSNR